MKDVKITCKDCGKEFTVSEQEQKWYKDRDFDLPKRCPECRKAKRRSSLWTNHSMSLGMSQISDSLGNICQIGCMFPWCIGW